MTRARNARNARLVVPALRLPGGGNGDGDLDFDLDPYLRLAERGVGGFCVFGGDSNLEATLDRLQDAARHPLLFASDLERGPGQQVEGMSVHPPAAALDPDAAETAGVLTALAARELGLTMTFAPVCDVLSEPRNPIIQTRAFREPTRSAPRFVKGAHLRGHGIRTCAKHFPGHGATKEDSHDALPVVDADEGTWHVRDLPPFLACFEAGVDAVMTAHLACPALTGSPDLPATLSRRVIHELLREELGFAGLVVTDALLMEGVRRGRSEGEAALAALAAGCDALLCPDDVEGVLAAVTRAGANSDLGPGMDLDASLERMAHASEPMPEPNEAEILALLGPDPLARAAAASVETAGDLPVPAGPHEVSVFDLDGAREAEIRTRFGALAVPGVVVLKSDRAWGGPMELPREVREAATNAPLLVLLGPRVLLDGLNPERRIYAPGSDPSTLDAVLARVRG